MIEYAATSLQVGDEFTRDNGETWHTVKVCRLARRDTRVVVINTDGKEVILKSDELVIVK